MIGDCKHFVKNMPHLQKGQKEQIKILKLTTKGINQDFIPYWRTFNNNKI